MPHLLAPERYDTKSFSQAAFFLPEKSFKHFLRLLIYTDLSSYVC